MTHTYTQTQATTIPVGQYWPRVTISHDCYQFISSSSNYKNTPRDISAGCSNGSRTFMCWLPLGTPDGCIFLKLANCGSKLNTKNIERHTAHTIASWPYPKQWVIVHTYDLMMIIRQSMYIFSIITTEMGKLKTHSPTYCIMDNWENMLNLTHTLDKLYLTGIL